MPITPPQSGQRIGEYLLDEQIGQGAFAQVWRGRHHVLKDKFVAFKIPTNEEYLRNLQKEGTIQHSVRHPNIVQTLGLDPWHDPPYLVMEYVDGRSLRDLLDEKKRLPHQEAVRITCAVLEALDAAHRHDVIHRDIKPENILLAGDGAVKVSDFGLGLATESTSLSLSVSLGSTDDARKIVGTLDYMAPEQRRNGETSPQSDIYSVGVVLYEMLTGALPVGRFKLPSEIDPKIPAWLDEVVERCLDPDVDDRAGTAANVLALLGPHDGRDSDADTRPQNAPEPAVGATEAAPPIARRDSGRRPNLLLDLARTDFRQGRLDEAMTKLVQAVDDEEAPKADVARLATEFGRKCRRKRKFSFAVKFFDFAIKHADETQLRLERAWALIEDGKTRKAESAFTAILREQPQDAEAKRGYRVATAANPIFVMRRRRLLVAHLIVLPLVLVLTLTLSSAILPGELDDDDIGLGLFEGVVVVAIMTLAAGICSWTVTPRTNQDRIKSSLGYGVGCSTVVAAFVGALLVMAESSRTLVLTCHMIGIVAYIITAKVVYSD